MAGTSGKPVVQKLGLKPGFCIFVDGLSVPYADVVGELPADVRIAKSAEGPLDVVHLFRLEVRRHRAVSAGDDGGHAPFRYEARLYARYALAKNRTQDLR